MVGREGDRELENPGEQRESWRRKEELTILGDGSVGRKLRALETYGKWVMKRGWREAKQATEGSGRIQKDVNGQLPSVAACPLVDVWLGRALGGGRGREGLGNLIRVW